MCEDCAFYKFINIRRNCLSESSTSVAIHAWLTYGIKCDKWDYKNNKPKYHKDKYHNVNGIMTLKE